ncbi:ABC transporter ATP-binding protein [uncultured Sphaerochaeta sp.]|uniref:ABC transporter ATP-binding protein n=1 Tax=uncultured Sphaerochaeta sp. TaxID=886478 RepID=UPI002A0A5CF1|nr:ABC transporter ATP-binding protein [uncultured Sphaerochaeta sp.]
MTAISLDHVSYTYSSGTEAIKDFSLEIEEGSTVALLGSNGAGKSTLMDMMLSWKKAQGITIFGKDICDYGRKELGRTLALVPQSENYNFSFTVLDYTLFGRAPYLSELGSPGFEDIEIAFNALETVGLQDFAKRSITALSGGEHQLLLLARSIAQQSRILLLDEPTSALDPANRRKVMAILWNLHEKGKTLVFSTHDANLALELATHVAMLRKGSLLTFGQKERVATSELLTTLYDTPLTVYSIEGKTFVY